MFKGLIDPIQARLVVNRPGLPAPERDHVFGQGSRLGVQEGPELIPAARTPDEVFQAIRAILWKRRGKFLQQYVMRMKLHL
jgi:hypothetical protein